MVKYDEFFKMAVQKYLHPLQHAVKHTDDARKGCTCNLKIFRFPDSRPKHFAAFLNVLQKDKFLRYELYQYCMLHL